MEKNSRKQLTIALAFVWCVPAMLVGCSTPTNDTVTGLVADTTASVKRGGVDKKPEPTPIAATEKPGTKPNANPVSARNADADNGMKIHPGSGVFVKPAKIALPPAGPQDIVLNFEGADLREVVRVVMGDMLNENYTIDPKVNGTVTIHTSQPINRAAVTPILETVLRMNGAAMVRENGVYKISPLNSALRGSTTPQVGALQPGYSVQVVQLQYIAAREMAKILEPLLPEGSVLRVDESRNLLMLAGAEGEMRHALETVSVFDLDWLAGMSVGLFTLKSVDVKSILPELESLFGDKSKSPFAGLLRIIPIERMNALFVVSPRPQYLDQARVWVDRLDRNSGKSGTRLHVYPVQNGNAEKIAALLGQVIGGKTATSAPAATVAPGLTGASVQSTGSLPAGVSAAATSAQSVVASGTGEALGLSSGNTVKVIADRDNNALLILANGAEYEKIEEAIKKLDVVPRQVLVEVTIAEVTLNGALSYGLEWFFNSNNNLSGMLFNSNANTRALPSDPTGTVTPRLPFSAVWRASGGNITAVLSALASNTKVNVISSPHIMVTDNTVAKINVGSSVPIQGQSTITGATGVITTSVSYVDTGVVLSVRPHINSGGLVTLEISQEVSDVQDGVTTTGLNSPTINKRSAQTTVAVQSGDTMVLGGLIKDDKNAGSSGLPFLSEIPVVGALFGAKTDATTRRELIITITPRVVTDNQQARDVTAEFRKKLTGMTKLNPEVANTAKSGESASTEVDSTKGN
jgi:general secretion pathway protein D